MNNSAFHFKTTLVATLLISTVATIFFLSPSLSTGAVPPTPAPGQLETTNYSTEAVILVAVVLTLLGGIFFLLMYWSQRSDRVSYLGSLYKETIEDIEYKRLAAGPSEKLNSKVYHSEIEMDETWLASNPPPRLPAGLPYQPSGTYLPGYGTVIGGLGGSRRPTGYTPPAGYTTIDDDDTDPAQRKEQMKLQDQWKKDRDNWQRKVDAEAQKRYQAELRKAREKAKERAGLAIDVDLSVLRGRGAEFVLEFTAVVVIIFAAVILGILKILDTQQIGTLLAAIAGYVLGRATQRGRNEPIRASKSEGAKETKGENSVHPLASTRSSAPHHRRQARHRRNAHAV